ncbi:MAG: molybdopterin-dependent oxidoreductase [Sulfuricaulis sp.]|nr:molybdopterin-dependent oxidoreductase [Sulfuricaulis sp.]
MHEEEKLRFAAARRRILRGLGVVGVGTLAGAVGRRVLASHTADTITQPFGNGERPLVQWPEKRQLIQLTTRPPQLDTPFSVFNEGVLTPNDAFFVRYHNAFIFGTPPTGPQTIDTTTFRLVVDGNVNRRLSLTVADLKTKFTPMETVAVCQCAGNSRGFFKPRVRGGQWAHGAMGNARWTGVALRDVLQSAGVGAAAVQVALDGLDTEAWGGVPDFQKAINIDLALGGEVMIAYAMNGADLPMLNGFPIRLVVPGYYATYWVKHLTRITVVDSVYDTFYMTTGYRIPNNDCACVPPGTTPTSTVPITLMNVRSFITSHVDGAAVSLALGQQVVNGIAFDGGSGIREVQFSQDGGVNWRAAQLGPDLGRYSYRPWNIVFSPSQTGTYVLQSRAVNNLGQIQPLDPLWNPPGYMHNIVESVRVRVTG